MTFSPASRVTKEAQMARLATSTLFLLNGLGFGNWASRIPAVRERIGLSENELGTALMCMALGAFLAIPLVGTWMSRIGSKRLAYFSLFFFCFVLALLPQAGHLFSLMAFVFCYGAAYGSLNLAMNAQASYIETQYGRPIMISFHGLWGAGALLGSLMGSGFAALQISPSFHMATVSLCFAGIGAFALPRLLNLAPPAAKHGSPFALPERALWGTTLIGFCAILCESAVADWSAVYLRSLPKVSFSEAAWGFSAYSLMMTLTRLSSDRLTRGISATWVIRGSGIIAATGILIAVLSGSLWGGILGFGLTGVGAAAMFPSVVRAAAHRGSQGAEQGIAAVSTWAFSASLLGSPSIGNLSNLLSLRWALLLLVGLWLVAAFLAPAAEPKRMST